MIKLIASDMDGTLLDENSQVPEETFELIHALTEKGIHFCASSGRRYDELCAMFQPVKDEMDFVACNGTQVYADGRMLDREVFSTHSVQRLFEMCETFSCLHLTLYDRTRTFVFDDMKVFPRHFRTMFPEQVRLYDPPDPSINIIRGNVYCDTADYTLDMTIVLTRELGERLSFMPSDSHWIDVAPHGVSKASGIKQVLRYRGIKPEDAAHFGDSMNDYDILRFVGHPYVMGNGSYAVKQITQHVIGTNAEHAVQKTLREILESL